MSTPLGKPFNPYDLSPYAPKRIREAGRSDEDPDGEAASAGDGADEAQVTRSSGADARPFALDDRPNWPVASAPKPANDPAAEPAGSDGTIAAADLARLESSLRWLQREGMATRLPRATPLASVPGLRPVNPDGPPLRDPQFIDGYRVPPSLTPERVPQPPRKGEARDHLRGSLRILLASALAAPIAYYFAVGLPGHSVPSGGPELASSESQPALLTTMQVPKAPVRVAALETGDHATLPVAGASAASGAHADVGSAPPPVATSPAVADAAPAQTPPGSAIAAVAPRAVKTVREVAPDTVRLLMQQGAQFVAAGDLVTARLLFQRAAEAGDATAALAMGATYDPIVLAKLGARGVGADVEKARTWYQKAEAFGSTEAPRRIEMLANR